MTSSRAPERAPRFRLLSAATALLLGAVGVIGGPAAAASAAPVYDLAALQAAFDAGGTVELGSNISGGRLIVSKDVVLELSGHTLTVVGGFGQAGVFVQSGATFTVGTSAGTLDATGNFGSAGIGGDEGADSGDIVIAGGTVVARTSVAAAIGSGDSGTGGNITISGGSVSAVSVNAVGIGAGDDASSGTITISGGTVVAEGPDSAIGSGSGSSVGHISISGGDVTATSSNGVGIGSGWSSRAGDILISGGTVVAKSDRGAAIGGGVGNPGDPAKLGSITISGGDVTATGGTWGPGIGVLSHPMSGVITISGGTVRATGGAESPGIGGYTIANPEIVISGGVVTAIGGRPKSGPSPIDRGGPGIGMGASIDVPGPIGAVTIGTGATVTVQSGVTSGSAIGAAESYVGFPAVTNAGKLIVQAGSTLRIPSTASVANQGTILGSVTGRVTGNSFLVTLAQPGVPGAGSEAIQVYAPTLAAAGVSIPTPTRADGPTFIEWNSRVTGVGTVLSPSTPLSTATWSAIWTPVGDPTSTTASISAPVVAAGTPVTLTASISPAIDGTITFATEAGALAGGLVTAGKFSLTIVSPPAGAHTITAVFEPFDTSRYRPSDATPMTLLVNAKKAQGPPPAADTDELLRLAALNGWPSAASGSNLAWTHPTDSFVDAFVYSTPVALGVLPVVGGTVDTTAITLPALAPGLHHLVFVGQTTGAVTIVPFTVANTAGPASTTRPAALPATGTDVAPWGMLAGILLLAGVALIVRQRGLRTI